MRCNVHPESTIGAENGLHGRVERCAGIEECAAVKRMNIVVIRPLGIGKSSRRHGHSAGWPVDHVSHIGGSWRSCGDKRGLTTLGSTAVMLWFTLLMVSVNILLLLAAWYLLGRPAHRHAM